MNIIKEFDFFVCLTDIFGKYAWAVLLKDKKGITITNAFQKNLFWKSLISKHGYLKVKNFTIDKWNHSYKTMI